MPKFITNGVACDWLTIGTWNEDTMLLLSPVPEGHDAKIRNYHGQSVVNPDGGSVFWGTGTQFANGVQRAHHMVQATGFSAQQMLADVVELVAVADRLVKCTRMDLQITVPLLPNTLFDLPNIARLFPDANSTKMGTGREVSLYPQGFGSASERYWRLYVKLDDQNAHYLRFEVMLRGMVSKQTFKAIRNHSEDMARVWLGEWERAIEKWPQLAEFGETSTAVQLAEEQAQGDCFSVVVARADTNTFGWLRDVAIPSARRFVNSHDTPLDQRGEILELLRRALWECTQ